MTKMKFILSAFIILGSLGLKAEDIKLKDWLHAGPASVNMPAFASIENNKGKAFKTLDLLKKATLNSKAMAEEGKVISLLNAKLNWSKLETKTDSVLLSNTKNGEIHLLSTYISVDRYTKAELSIHTNAWTQIYLDGKLVKTKKNGKFKKATADLSLSTGKHQILIKALTEDASLKFVSDIKLKEKYESAELTASTSPKRFIKVNDVISGTNIKGAKLSPSGKYYLLTLSEKAFSNGKSHSVTYLKEIKTNKNIIVFRNKAASSYKWLPNSDRLSYTISFNKTKELYVYDVEKREEQLIAKNLKDFSRYYWAPTEDKIIYSVYQEADKPGDLKRIYGVDDRLPYFRGRSFLNMLYVNSGNTITLTHGRLSTSLQDIHPQGNKIIFSTSDMDYSQESYRLQCMYEMNLTTFKLDTIWKNKVYGGSVQYSPDGKTLLVTGGPECFGKLGMDVAEGVKPNNYDTQMYLMDLATKNVKAISKDFDPSIDDALWFDNNTIYTKVIDRDFKNMYRYDVKKNKYEKINLKVDVLSKMSFAKKQPLALYSGTSITSPNKLYLLNAKKNTSTLINDAEANRMKEVMMGNTEEFNFVNSRGTTIYGRSYFPPNYDASKKYPVIVYYYGGTSAVERSFGGRYPKNVWAANGYIVYILQPSGAPGFGQEFSALHVNGWGREAIDDIIEGTKAFLKATPSADAKNVGCMGASYGGFTTMLLQTRTDIFKTAISHAGISSITSYWGEGYWGYTYSSVASAGAYPWNRKDVYVENSPIYNADKFQNSILLIHGTSDTNVPVGESKQMYAALKILGKDVEMVLVDGEDHWVIDHKKRLAWHNTIMSWFDKKLKDQPQHWDELYPEKNY